MDGMAKTMCDDSLKLQSDQQYHLVGCSSPEYRCYPPFADRSCSTKQDCNYALAQLRWGLQTALELTNRFGLSANLSQRVGSEAEAW